MRTSLVIIFVLASFSFLFGQIFENEAYDTVGSLELYAGTDMRTYPEGFERASFGFQVTNVGSSVVEWEARSGNLCWWSVTREGTSIWEYPEIVLPVIVFHTLRPGESEADNAVWMPDVEICPGEYLLTVTLNGYPAGISIPFWVGSVGPSSPVITTPDTFYIRYGEAEEIALNDMVIDHDTPVDELTWDITEPGHFVFEYLAGNVIRVRAEDGFYGTEMAIFRVADPDGNADTANVFFTSLPPDAENLELVDIYAVSNIIFDIDIDGDNLAVITETRGVELFSIEDSIALLSHRDFFATGLGCAISGDYLFYTRSDTLGSSLVALDISDPCSPVVVDSISFTGTVGNIDVDGDYLYLAAGYQGLKIYDISHLPGMSDAGSVDIPARCVDVAVSGGLAGVITSNDRLYIVDVTEPGLAEVLAWRLDIAEDAVDIAAMGDRFFVASTEDYVTEAYIESGEVEAVQVPTVAPSFGLAVWERVLFVAMEGEGLSAFTVYPDFLSSGYYRTDDGFSRVAVEDRSVVAAIDSVLYLFGYTGTDDIVEIHPQKVGLSLYPNPFNDALRIDFKKDVVGKLEIFNIRGERVFTDVISGGREYIWHPVSLPSGVYTLLLTTKEGRRFEKGVYIR